MINLSTVIPFRNYLEYNLYALLDPRNSKDVLLYPISYPIYYLHILSVLSKCILYGQLHMSIYELNASCYGESLPLNSNRFTILCYHRKHHSNKVMKEGSHPLKFAEAAHLGNYYI